MAKQIIAALRRLPQLKGSTLLAAVELAHRADASSGVAYVSYSYLAAKCHQSRRTAIRQVHRLLALGLITCQRFWQPGGKWGINKYRFCVAWDKPRAAPPVPGGSDTLTPRVPQEEQSSGKWGTVAGLERAKTRALGWLTPGSTLWELTMALQVTS